MISRPVTRLVMERCQNVRLAAAADFLMPVAMAG